MINLTLPSPTISPLSSPNCPISLPPQIKHLAAPLLSNQKSEIPAQEMSPRFLRRRARSSLVDAFRLYVLHELNQRLPQGGYYIWVLNSLLRDARESRNAFLMKEREFERQRENNRFSRFTSSPRPNSSSSSGSSVSQITFGKKRSNPRHIRGPSIETETFSATTACEPPTSDDELDEADSPRHDIAGSDETDDDINSIETETDGSSIQTPSSSHFTLPLPTRLPSVSASRDLTSLVSSPTFPTRDLPRSRPLTPRPHPVDVQIQTLTQLILLHTSHSARTAHDECARLDALEVRGRRRAWLNRALCYNGLKLTAPPGGRVSTNLQRIEIGMGAGYGGLGFSIPIRRSSLGMWVVTAEDVDFDPVVVRAQHDRESICHESEQRDAIMCEEDDVDLVGGDTFTGYDERNGIASKRTKVSVPSNGVQLFPVNEIEEEEHSQCPNALSELPDIVEYSDDDDSDSSTKYGGLSLDQYDDIRGLQMDLDIATGVGFDMMDFSDEEDTDADVNKSSSLPSPDGEIPEGGICVSLEIPQPKAFYTRSPHLLFGQKRNQRQDIISSEAYPVHEYPHSNTVPPRCSTPIPPIPTSESADASLSHCQSLILPAKPTLHPQPPCLHSSTTSSRGSFHPSSLAPDTFDSKVGHISSAAEIDLESGMCKQLTESERKQLPRDIDVNEIGELVVRTNTMSLRGDTKEFTLAMDLPSKIISSKFGDFSFAAIGHTKAFGSRVRGALKARNGAVEENVAVEGMESGTAWV